MTTSWPDVRSMDIRRVVDDPTWQTLRASLVGTWKRSPAANVARLREYLAGRWQDPFAVRRVLNYLTGSGFRIGIISHPDIGTLLSEVRRVWTERTKGAA